MKELREQLKLKKIQVTNFRNLNPDVVEFCSKINCIFGQNGNGKTNLLEAIHFLIHRKSFRKNTGFSQMLSMDAGEAEIKISAVFESGSDDSNSKNALQSYSGKITPDGATWYAANMQTKKRPGVEAVFINPFDSHAFHTTPAFRREWFDKHISMFDDEYRVALRKYGDALKFRNALLAKKPPKFREQVLAIDPELTFQAETLTRLRLAFIEKIQNQFAETFKKIFSEHHALRINLESKLHEPYAEHFRHILKENLSKDEIIGHTSYGIHKDDYNFEFDGVNAFDYCSLGQQKMSYLSLLFAYIELFRYKFLAYPIVLIDDVSGELDASRWQRLIDYLKDAKFQVLISTANENFREELERVEGTKVMRICITQGTVSQL